MAAATAGASRVRAQVRAAVRTSAATRGASPAWFAAYREPDTGGGVRGVWSTVPGGGHRLAELPPTGRKGPVQVSPRGRDPGAAARTL